MNYQTKYYYTFKSLNEDEYRVEILQNLPEGQGLNPVRIIGDSNTCIVEYPNISNKFEPIHGSGCELNLLSVTDMQFIDLYTADMLEYKINIYKNNNIFWLGFLDSELYNEPFNQSFNYGVTFTGSDGFALLDRLYYVGENELDPNGSANYTGIISHFDMIKNIMGKLDLDFENVYISLSTTPVLDYVNYSANETILHKTLSIQSNWYDEDNQAMTCREVLENILKIYGAFMVQHDGNLYITDVNSISNPYTNFKKYNKLFEYQFTTINNNNNIGDLSNIGFASDSSRLTVTPAINKQVINYSQYRNTKVIDYEANIADYTNSGNTTTRYFGVSGETGSWSEVEYDNSKTWILLNNNKCCQSFDIQGKAEDCYIKIYANADPNDKIYTFIYRNQLPYIIPWFQNQIHNYSLRLKMSAFFRFSDIQPYTNTNGACYGIIKARLKIGNRKFVYDYDRWRTNLIKYLGFSSNIKEWKNLDFEGDEWYSAFFEIPFFILNSDTGLMENIGDQWVDVANWQQNILGKFENKDFLIPLAPYLYFGGEFNLEIYEPEIYERNFKYPNDQTINNNLRASLKDVRIKNIQIELVNTSDSSSIEGADVEYVGFVSPKLKNTGSVIKLLQGTSVDEICLDRGGLIYSVPPLVEGLESVGCGFIQKWTREGHTDTIENLLLRSIISNYNVPNLQINCTVNHLTSIVGYLTYNSILPNKKFMITNLKRNLSDNDDDITIQEVMKDTANVKTNY